MLFTVCALAHIASACVDLVMIFYYWLILANAPRETRATRGSTTPQFDRKEDSARRTHKLWRITLQRVSNAGSCEFGDDADWWLRWWWMSPAACRQFVFTHSCVFFIICFCEFRWLAAVNSVLQIRFGSFPCKSSIRKNFELFISCADIRRHIAFCRNLSWHCPEVLGSCSHPTLWFYF